MGSPDYGLGALVVLNSAMFILFAFSFFKLETSGDWRSFGAFSAFLVVRHVNLARHEEKDASAIFGEAYQQCGEATPAWWPVFRRFSQVSPQSRA